MILNSFSEYAAEITDATERQTRGHYRGDFAELRIHICCNIVELFLNGCGNLVAVTVLNQRKSTDEFCFQRLIRAYFEILAPLFNGFPIKKLFRDSGTVNGETSFTAKQIYI